MPGQLLRRAWYFLNRRRFERDLEREMAAHRAEMEDPSRFGSPLRLRERSRDVWGWTWIDDVRQDVRYGLRQLRRAPVFVCVAVITLSVGIAANVTAFGITKTILFAELPLPDPQALRQLAWGERPSAVGEATFRHFAANARGFTAVTCVTQPMSAAVAQSDREDAARAIWVAGDFVRTFGVAPALGRPLTPTDDQPGAAAVAMVSHEWWQRDFGGDRSVIGARIVVNSTPVTIIGVMPRRFVISTGAPPVDLTLPMRVARSTLDDADSYRPCRIIGRLNQHTPEEATRQEADALLKRSGLPLPIDDQPPLIRARMPLQLRTVGRGIDELRPGQLRSNLPQISGAVFLLIAVLLVPCANVGAILLARAVSRRSEIVARMALGASRGRLIRQLLTEGALLAAAAGTVGMALSWWALSALAASSGGVFAEPSRFGLDPALLAMTAGVCALATVSFALAPALTATRGDLATRIREASGGISGGWRWAPGSVLVAVQVLLSCVILAAAVLQAQGLVRATASTATSPDHVLLVTVELPQARSTDGYLADALTQLTSVPGVLSAGARSVGGLSVGLCDRAPGRGERRVDVWEEPVTPGYFATLTMPLRHGRELAETDRRGAPVAIINDSLARLMFGSANPVGLRLPLARCEPDGAGGIDEPLTIAGVVDDRRTQPAMYLPFDHFGTAGLRKEPVRFGALELAVRTSGAADTLPASIRRALRGSGGAIRRMETLEARRASSTGAVRVLALAFVALAMLATAQAAFGLYGTLAHFIGRRTAEIGLRMVLGAGASSVVRLVSRQALMPVIVGLLIGLLLGPVVATVMQSGALIGPAGAAEFALLAAAVAAVMLLACAASAVPLWRATRINPAAALRQD